MAGTLHVFDFLEAPSKHVRGAVYVLFGGEVFLKRLAKQALVRELMEGDDGSFDAFDGETAEWRDVLDELSTASLFGGGKRVAVIEEADKFVTKHRDRLEDYVAKPRSTGVLVLEVDTWASNTRLYKSVEQAGVQVECRPPEIARGKSKSPDEKRMLAWLTQWGRQQHQTTLPPDAAKALLDLVGPEFGLLDQELAKLALFVDAQGVVSAPVVNDVVGGWRTKTTWELIDAAVDGQAGEALRQFDRLLHSGQEPIALFGQIAWSLRRFAMAARIFRQAEKDGRRLPLAVALEQAGFNKWAPGGLEKPERQLLQLGRERASRLYRWLLEADLSLKGSHSSPSRSRFVLEQLFVRMAKELGPRAVKR